MDPLTVTVGFITLALKFANSDGGREIAAEGKKLITALFNHGLITKADQDRTHAHIDAVCDAFLAVQEPPSWNVEPDPAA